MQTLGLGTLLMVLIAIAIPFTAKFATQSVGLAVLAIWPILIAFSLWQALAIKPRKIEIASEKIKSALRLVQISDVHIGSRSGKFMSHVVELVNKQKPELVVITGDLLDASSVGIDELASLKLATMNDMSILTKHCRLLN